MSFDVDEDARVLKAITSFDNLFESYALSYWLKLVDGITDSITRVRSIKCPTLAS